MGYYIDDYDYTVLDEADSGRTQSELEIIAYYHNMTVLEYLQHTKQCSTLEENNTDD